MATARIASGLLLAALSSHFGLWSAAAQEKAAGAKTVTEAQAAQSASGAAAARSKRLLYPVRHGDAAGLAKRLETFFQGDAVNVTPAAFDEVRKTLMELDRAPGSVFLELVVVELAAGADKEADADTDKSAADLSGPIDQVNGRLSALSKSGQITSIKRLRLTAAEGGKAQAQAGEERSVASNVTINATTGKAFPVFDRRSIGTIIQVAPRIVSDSNLVLEMTVRDDRVVVPATPFVLGQGADGPIIAPELVTSNFSGKLIVKSGQAVTVQGLQNNSKEKKGRLLAIVMARIENAAEAK